MLNRLAFAAGVELAPLLLALQPFAVKALYEAGPFPLPACQLEILQAIDRLREAVIAQFGEG